MGDEEWTDERFRTFMQRVHKTFRDYGIPLAIANLLGAILANRHLRTSSERLLAEIMHVSQKADTGAAEQILLRHSIPLPRMRSTRFSPTPGKA